MATLELCYYSVTLHEHLYVLCQVAMATSMTTHWGDFCVTQSCMKLVPGQVKFADSSLDEPSTPCSNKAEGVITKRLRVVCCG